MEADPHDPAQARPAGRTDPGQEEDRRIAVIAGTAALTTAVSGIVGGVVSPDRVQSVLGLSDGSTESPSSDTTPTALRVGPDPDGFFIQSDETAYVGAAGVTPAST